MTTSEREEKTEADRKELPLVLDLLITALITVAAVVVLRTFVIDGYMIPTGSMLETIQLDDMLFGEKVSYRFRSPEQGEIITFDDPDEPGVTLIKRVIAVEGQTVDLVDGRVMVDGAVLDEPYTQGKPSYPIDRFASNLTGLVSYPITIPEGCVWVMGDNRTNSLDSRYFGPVRVSSVQSRAIFIYWPPSDMGAL